LALAKPTVGTASRQQIVIRKLRMNEKRCGEKAYAVLNWLGYNRVANAKFDDRIMQQISKLKRGCFLADLVLFFAIF
jgi:hypothetical protein